jgi:meso-butanediol dehydrogenase/(S,S)-butanediol dehydrogenase/diacetyl reductase
MGRLDGKRALISGTGGGIGRATALLCAREGAHVVGCDLDPRSSEETVALVRAGGGRMDAVAPVDLATEAGARGWVGTAAALAGGIDVLVNNASAIRFGPIDELSFADWSFTIRNELDIVFLVTRAAWPYLVAGGGGSIVNVASITASRGAFFMPQNAHGAAKGGVLALTYQLVIEPGDDADAAHGPAARRPRGPGREHRGSRATGTVGAAGGRRARDLVPVLGRVVPRERREHSR